MNFIGLKFLSNSKFRLLIFWIFFFQKNISFLTKKYSSEFLCHKMWAVITTLLLFRSKSCIITQSNLTTKESFWLKNQFSSQHQNQEDYFLEFLHLSTIITRFIIFEHTVKNLHFLSKNSTLISWENYRLFWVKNSWKCCGFGLFSC